MIYNQYKNGFFSMNKKGQLVKMWPVTPTHKATILTLCQWKKCATIELSSVWNLKRKMCQEVSNFFYY